MAHMNSELEAQGKLTAAASLRYALRPQQSTMQFPCLACLNESVSFFWLYGGSKTMRRVLMSLCACLKAGVVFLPCSAARHSDHAC